MAEFMPELGGIVLVMNGVGVAEQVKAVVAPEALKQFDAVGRIIAEDLVPGAIKNFIIYLQAGNFPDLPSELPGCDPPGFKLPEEIGLGRLVEQAVEVVHAELPIGRLDFLMANVEDNTSKIKNNVFY